MLELISGIVIGAMTPWILKFIVNTWAEQWAKERNKKTKETDKIMFDFWKKKTNKVDESLNEERKDLIKEVAEEQSKEYLGRHSRDIQVDLKRMVEVITSTSKRLNDLEILIQTLSERNTDAMDMMEAFYEYRKEIEDYRREKNDSNLANYASAESWEELSRSVPEPVRSAKQDTKAKRKPSKPAR